MKIFLRFILNLFVYCILLLVVGFCILVGRNLMRIISYKIKRLHEEPTCNISQTQFLKGYFTLQDDAIIDKMDRNTLLDNFQRYLKNRQWKCCYVETLRKNDGSNNVVCMDELNKTGIKCSVLIFSFSSLETFKLERESWKGFFCQMCVFDYRAETTPLKLPSNTCYRNWGLSAKSTESGDLKSLSDILQTLQHHGIIHYMKLNAGAWDWDTLSTMIESGELDLVKQLSLEMELNKNSHPSRHTQWNGKVPDITSMKTSLKTLRKLHEHGFRIVTVEPADFSVKTDVISLLFLNSNLFGQIY